MSSADVLQDDLRELLCILGISDHARPQSPHEVFQEALAVLRQRKVVPLTATKTMIDAAYAAHDAFEASAEPGAWCGLYSVYEAMIAATPYQNASDGWCYDIKAAPRDKTPVLLTVPPCVGDEPIVGEAYFNPDDGAGTWWWAGTSAHEYPAISINEGNKLPIAWRPMPRPAQGIEARSAETSGSAEGESPSAIGGAPSRKAAIKSKSTEESAA